MDDRLWICVSGFLAGYCVVYVRCLEVCNPLEGVAYKLEKVCKLRVTEGGHGYVIDLGILTWTPCARVNMRR